jgi:LPS-assembly lipoprotein
MSWSRRSLLAGLALAGCGFSPALAPQGSAAELRGDIEVSAPPTRPGYYLARQLETRLGLPSSPSYRLQAQITQGAQVTGIPANRVTARVNILGEVDYTLVYTPTGQVVTRGSVQSFTGLTSTSTTAATRTALEDANRRLMVILADRVVADLLATSEEWRL